MRYVLENEMICAEINSYGAELRSLKGKRSMREYLWQANPEYWNRTSPVLFPFVGRLQNFRYQYQGKDYQMLQHGFARDKEFILVDRSEQFIELSLTDDVDSREIYPFSFELKIRYELRKSSIVVQWQVKNRGENILYFAIGSHPAFLCPFSEEENICRLKFYTENQNLYYQKLDSRYLCQTEKYPMYLIDGIWSFQKTVFDDDVMIFPDYQVRAVSILKEDENPYLTIESRAPLTGVWSPPGKNAPFLCIEPWYGRCDAAERDLCLEKKEYMNSLAGGAAFFTEYRIKVHE